MSDPFSRPSVKWLLSWCFLEYSVQLNTEILPLELQNFLQTAIWQWQVDSWSSLGATADPLKGMLKTGLTDYLNIIPLPLSAYCGNTKVVASLAHHTSSIFSPLLPLAFLFIILNSQNKNKQRGRIGSRGSSQPLPISPCCSILIPYPVWTGWKNRPGSKFWKSAAISLRGKKEAWVRRSESHAGCCGCSLLWLYYSADCRPSHSLFLLFCIVQGTFSLIIEALHTDSPDDLSTGK